MPRPRRTPATAPRAPARHPLLGLPLLTPALLTRALLTSALLGIALLLAVPHPAAAAGEPWSAGPAAGGDGGGRGRPYFYLEGAPGAVLEDRIALTNPGARPLTVRLSGAGAVFRAPRVSVPPRTRAEVPFGVAVARNAAPGERSWALVAEAGGRAVRVPLHLRVKGPALAALAVEGVRADRAGVHYTLVNRGNTALAPRVAVRVDGIFGARLDRPAGAARPLAPGERAAGTLRWPGGAPTLDRVSVTVAATAPGAEPAEARATGAFVTWWWVAVGGALAAGLAGAGRFLLWPRLRARGGARESADGRDPVEVDVEADLEQGELTGAVK
ncbi:hypothetical protein [Streptomyces sp. NPDC050504]|uniref:hypothetical protein n=1 Tax=Streptomyces sp. NPDC050504 TaxID=3365618 RepID=UPI0037BCEF49